MFRGFDVKFPEYEVITPQTNLSFTVRSLTVKEEERMKGSLVSSSKILEHLNKCIYDSIIAKPEHVTDYDSFLKSVTLKDRDALLYGLYHISYEEIRNYDITCNNCQKEYPVTIKASSTFNYTPYPGSDVLTKRIPIDLSAFKGVVCTLKQPTLYDEMMAIKTYGANVSTNLDLIIETLIIDRFSYNPEEGDTVIYSETGDILDAYMSLAAKDKRLIHEAYKEHFGKYGILLRMRTSCIYCGVEDEANLDLVTNFFRMVFTV